MKNWTILLSAMFLQIIGCSQQGQVQIEKTECSVKSHLNKGGSRLVVKVEIKEISMKSGFTYDFEKFRDIPYQIKIKIIKKLLEFENDTSVSCKEVAGHQRGYIDYCPGSYRSKRYPINIEALFMINRIYFNSDSFPIEYYSCSPVLYDTLTKEEINWDLTKIKLVYKEYHKWLEEIKDAGMVNYSFPFNNGRYVWYGGRKSLEAKE